MRKMEEQDLCQAAGGVMSEKDVAPGWTNVTRRQRGVDNCREFKSKFGNSNAAVSICTDCVNCAQIKLATGQTQYFCKKGL